MIALFTSNSVGVLFWLGFAIAIAIAIAPFRILWKGQASIKLCHGKGQARIKLCHGKGWARIKLRHGERASKNKFMSWERASKNKVMSWERASKIKVMSWERASKYKVISWVMKGRDTNNWYSLYLLRRLSMTFLHSHHQRPVKAKSCYNANFVVNGSIEDSRFIITTIR